MSDIWEYKRVKDVATISTGSKDTQDREMDAEYPFFVRSQTVERISSFSFDCEAVLTAGDGVGVGIVFHYHNGKFDVHQRVYCIHSFSKSIFGPFFYHYFKNQFFSRVSKLSAKGSVDSVRMSMIADMKIPLPEFLEQTKIAEVLSKVDQAIEQTKNLIAKQQRIKTGLMQDLLTRGIDENGNLRSEETHEFKNSPLGRIPVEWEVRTCDQLCKQIVVGIVVRPVQYYRREGVPMLRSANVQESYISAENLVYMSTADNEKLSKSQIFTGDLVTVRTGYPGTTSVVPSEFNGCNCIDIVISRPDKDRVRSEFLSIWINSDLGKRQVLEGQGGLAQQHFNVGEMKSLLVKAPPLKEQALIEKILLKQSIIMKDIEKNLKKLHSLKTALMQDLLSGDVRVTPLLEKMEANS